MNRPVLYAAALAAAGTLCGLNEAGTDLRIIALVISVVLILKALERSYKSGNKRSASALIYSVIFLVFILRATAESGKFDDPESREFYAGYEVTVPGQFDYGLYLKSRGIVTREDYEAYLGDSEADTSRNPAVRAAAGIRGYIALKLDEYMGADDAGIYKAILTGDKSEITEDIKSLYQTAGISHLLAISGLHVSLIGGGLFRLLTRIFKVGKITAGIIASLFLCFFTLICGSAVSAVRASIMLILMFISLMSGRIYDMRTAAAVSLMYILFARPYRIMTAGTQLSFAAVGAIAILAERLIKGTEKRIKYIRARKSRYTGSAYRLPGPVKTTIVSLSIQLTMLPVLAWHYFTFPLYGFFLNFLVIPLMGLVLLSGLTLTGLAAAADLMYLFSQKAGSVTALLAGLSAAPGHYILKFYKFLCEVNAMLPHAVIVTGRPSVYHIAVYFVIIALITIKIGRPEAKCGGILFPKNKMFTTAALFSAFFLNAAFLRYYEPKAFYVCALDCGQGDGFIIRAGDIYISVDCGSSSDKKLGERTLEPYLLSKRIENIDVAVISHADSDHISGIEYLLNEAQNISLRNLVLPGPAGDSAEYDSLKAAFINAGGSEDRIFYLKDLTRILTVDDVTLTSIYSGNADARDVNRHSDVILLEKGESFGMLFTGDAVAEDEDEIAALYNEAKTSGLSRAGGLNVLKVGHHGSRTSTSEAFLDALSPETAILSCGAGNSYGHPHEEVTLRLEERDILTLSTADNGSLLITEEGISKAR